MNESNHMTLNTTAEAEPSPPKDSTAQEEPEAPTAPPRSTMAVVALWCGGLAICAMVATILSLQNGGGDTSASGLPAPYTAQAQRAGAGGLAGGGYFVIVCLYALAAAAAFSDAALRLVPNRFTYTALILALLLNLVIAPFCELMEWEGALLWIGANAGPWGGVALESLKGFGLCFLVGVISFAARGLGGGDVKLLMALGALAGFSLTVSILLNTLAVAAVIGILNLLFRGSLIQVLQRFV
ncbi:MAG: prepilin peptidase, partial [Planctomycetota bacterium]